MTTVWLPHVWLVCWSLKGFLFCTWRFKAFEQSGFGEGLSIQHLLKSSEKLGELGISADSSENILNSLVVHKEAPLGVHKEGGFATHMFTNVSPQPDACSHCGKKVLCPPHPPFYFFHIFPLACHPCWQLVPEAGPDAGATRGAVLSSHFPGPARDSHTGVVTYLGCLPFLYAQEGTSTSSSPSSGLGSAAESSALAGALGRVTPFSCPEEFGSVLPCSSRKEGKGCLSLTL